MTREQLTAKLISEYPNCIVCDDDMVMFEETVGNLAEIIMTDMSEKRLKGFFGMIFENEEDCYYYLLNDLPGLLEECQEYVWNKKN